MCLSFLWTACLDFDSFSADSWCVDQNACAMYGKEHCYSYDWINLNCPKLCGLCGNGECNLMTGDIVRKKYDHGFLSRHRLSHSP